MIPDPDILRTIPHVEEAILRIETTHRLAGWRRDLSVGVLVDLGFHALDLARDLFGDIRLKSGSLFDENGGFCHDRFDSVANLLFVTESGTHLRVFVKRGAEKKCEIFEAVGGEYRLRVARGSLFLTRNEEVIHDFQAPPDWNQAMLAQLEDFFRACGNPGSHVFSGKAGLVTMKLLEEAYTHAATH